MKKEIRFLKELQKELQTHDKDYQEHPRFWAILDYRWVPTWDDLTEKVIIVSPGYKKQYELEELVKDVIAYKFNVEADALLEFEDELDKDNEKEVLHWYQKNIDKKAYLVPLRLEEFIVPGTIFLTKKEAKKHLDENHHQYSNKAHVYSMTAKQAPTVTKLLTILETIDWEEIEKKITKSQ